MNDMLNYDSRNHILSVLPRKRKTELEKAMEEVAKGKVNEHQSVDELFTKLGLSPATGTHSDIF